MKTIFITVGDGEVSNNILRSVIFPKLKEWAFLVLFVPVVPAHKAEYYKRSISSIR